MNEQKGMFGTLFDFSFTHFITAKLVKLLFAIGILGALVGSIKFIGGGFDLGVGRGILALLISPVVFLVLSLLVRVALEIIIVLFRIAESVQTLAEHQTKEPAAADAGPGYGRVVDSPDGASTVISMDAQD